MFEGVRLLERCIGARRAGEQQPDIGGFLADVSAKLRTLDGAESLDPGGEAASGARGETAPESRMHPPSAERESGELASDPDQGEARLYRFEFTPSRELAARGVGVEAIRARLQSWGTVIAARPRVLPGRPVAFEFVVAAGEGATPDEAWRADSLTWAVDVEAESRSVELATIPSSTPATRAVSDESIETFRSKEQGPAGGDLSILLPTSDIVRVDLSRLDEVMRMVGELVISRARLEETLRVIDEDGSGESSVGEALRETVTSMDRQLRSLREGVMRIRLVPIGDVFERLRFSMREVARESGKLVRLELSGQGTEIDKLVVDRMLEPLLHLVRNAVSHGIESPEERRAIGKPSEGRLALRATAAGDRIVIEVEDDGAGIDVERVGERARAHGLTTGSGPLDGDALLDVLCEQGFSTRSEANMASGRGLGMAVVRSTIRALGGELSLETERGRGTRFIAEIPLTLMIVDALLVEIGPHQMAVPQPVLREILRVDAESPTRFEANAVMPYRGNVLPLVSLSRLFGMGDSVEDPFFVLVVGSEAHPLGLMVDRIVGLREIVVHPVSDPLVAVPGISGATELGDGRVCLIIDAGAVARMAQDRGVTRLSRGRAAPALRGAAPVVHGTPPALQIANGAARGGA